MDKGRGGSLRAELPDMAAWIDSLRRAFGKDRVDEQIRRGMKGEPTFAVYSTDDRDPPLLMGTRRPPDPAGTRIFDADAWLAFVHSADNKSEFGK